MQDLTFNLRPSRTLMTLMGLFLSFTIIIILMLPIAALLKSLSLIGILCYGSMLIWKFGSLRGRHTILGFRRLSNGQLTLHFRNHSSLALLYGDSTVTPFISILRFHLISPLSFKPSCIILPDSLPKDDYRRLLSVLKVGGLQLVS